MRFDGFLILAILGGAALGFCLVPCCTVKEDRDSCPGVLVLRTDLVAEEVDSLFFEVSGPTTFSDVQAAPFGEEYRYSVDRGEFSLLAGSTATDGGALTIEYGLECPELWLWRGETELYGEIQSVSPELHKRYCRLTLTALSSVDPYPYAMAVSGNVCGYSSDGEPVEGDFYVLKSLSSGNSCSVCLPRQIDNSLMLDLMAEDESVRSFAIGEYIGESGYDWEAEDLADITLQVDFAGTSITLSYDNWSYTLTLSHTV